MAEDHPRIISRRELLRGVGAVGAAGAAAAAGVPLVDAAGGGAQAAQPGQTGGRSGVRPHVYEYLTAAEAEVLEAIVGHLIPADASGPGALEAGALRYIDRSLGGALSGSREAYRTGLAALDRYCRSSRGAPFLQLSHTDQYSALIDVESGAATGAGAGFAGSSAAFFNMVKSHTWQGTFGDPYYGGNVDFIGWDLIRYPGVRTTVSAADQQRLEQGQLNPTRRSAYETDMFNKATVRAGAQGDATHGD
jgi:gluconate 2-dehydrogenase gamma chain